MEIILNRQNPIYIIPSNVIHIEFEAIKINKELNLMLSLIEKFENEMHENKIPTAHAEGHNYTTFDHIHYSFKYSKSLKTIEANSNKDFEVKLYIKLK